MNCQHQWSRPEDIDQFPWHRMRVPPEKILKGTALLVLGTTLSEIEVLTGLKSESLRAYIERWLRTEAGRVYLEIILTDRYGVPQDHLINFMIGVNNWLRMDNRKISIFRVWGQRIRRGTALDQAGARRARDRILGKVKSSRPSPENFTSIG